MRGPCNGFEGSIRGWIRREPTRPADALEIEVREPATRHTLTVKQVRDYALQTPTSPAEKMKRHRLSTALLA
jgi:hypothetical protein